MTTVVIGLDLVICLIYTIYMYAIKKLINRSVKDFDSDSVQITDYAI
jgi:hypothetical protein